MSISTAVPASESLSLSLSICNITSEGAVDQEFVYIIELPLDALWLLRIFGVPLGSLWPFVGVPFAVLGHI